MATPEISCAGVKSQQLGAGFSKEKVEEGLAGGGGCRTPSLIWLPIEHTVCVGSWGWRLECERWRWTGLGIAGAEPGVVAGGVRWSFIGGPAGCCLSSSPPNTHFVCDFLYMYPYRSREFGEEGNALLYLGFSK
ncbi:hypothetical protein R6Q59_002188 [Mikania micrantha]